MKRIHLFEFEDFPWFPNWLRTCMTRYIIAVHKLLGSAGELAGLIARVLPYATDKRILDVCSGAGGPMLEVVSILKEKHQVAELELAFSDLYPNQDAARRVASLNNPAITYLLNPINATQIPKDQPGLRTMVCSMHHMRPEVAKAILRDAKASREPICVFEISDNSFPPTWLWWVGLPLNFLSVFFITPFVRPLTWQQLVFTYLIPLLPLFIAWDGAVSNVRTYTLSDMEELLTGLQSADYHWETGRISGRAKKLYLLGHPV